MTEQRSERDEHFEWYGREQAELLRRYGLTEEPARMLREGEPLCRELREALADYIEGKIKIRPGPKPVLFADSDDIDQDNYFARMRERISARVKAGELRWKVIEAEAEFHKMTPGQFEKRLKAKSVTAAATRLRKSAPK